MKDFPEWDEVMQICREMREVELAEFDRQSQGDAFATPAIHNGRLLVRSDKYLYCLGTK